MLATDLKPVEQTLDDNEFLSVHSVPVADAVEVARTEPTNDATLEGILLASEADLL